MQDGTSDVTFEKNFPSPETKVQPRCAVSTAIVLRDACVKCLDKKPHGTCDTVPKVGIRRDRGVYEQEHHQRRLEREAFELDMRGCSLWAPNPETTPDVFGNPTPGRIWRKECFPNFSDTGSDYFYCQKLWLRYEGHRSNFF